MKRHSNFVIRDSRPVIRRSKEKSGVLGYYAPVITAAVLVVFVGGVMFGLAWTDPTAAPPGGNVAAPLNVGPDQEKIGKLTAADFCLPAGGACLSAIPGIIAGGNLWTQSGASLFPRDLGWNVGIGTNAPSEKLHVSGTVKADKLIVGNVQICVTDVLGNCL